jgi:hypothetical protein
MRVKDFIEKEGIERFVESKPESFEALPEEGAHRIQFFIKEGECRFNSSKRCKKLLALAEVACRLVEEGKMPSEEELLSFFSEERDKEKMRARAELVVKALKR